MLFQKFYKSYLVNIRQCRECDWFSRFSFVRSKYVLCVLKVLLVVEGQKHLRRSIFELLLSLTHTQLSHTLHITWPQKLHTQTLLLLFLLLRERTLLVRACFWCIREATRVKRRTWEFEKEKNKRRNAPRTHSHTYSHCLGLIKKQDLKRKRKA